MFIRIQRGASVPISRQIDAQIRAQILAGALPAEQQLPSVRELARDLAVNVNTIVRVYEKLAGDGLIELRHGDGTYVAPRRKSTASSQLAQRRRELDQDFDSLVRRALMLGLAPDELTRCLADSIERVRRDASLTDQLSRGTEPAL
jgi:GntR family transcriptional regulator